MVVIRSKARNTADHFQTGANVNILEVITSVPGRNLDIQPPDDTGDWLNQGNVWWNRKTSEFAKKPKYVDKYDAPPDATTTTATTPSNTNTTPNKTPAPVGSANQASADYSVIWPAGDKSKVTPGRHFGAGHGGIDISPLPVGTPVVAPEDGTVIDTKEDKAKAGLYVKLRSKDGQRVHSLLHLSRIECYNNQTVKQGQRLGLSGGEKGAKGAGNSTGPHLHWSVTVNGQSADPVAVADASKKPTANPTAKQETPAKKG